MFYDTTGGAATAAQLNFVVRELERLGQRLIDSATVALALAAATDWQARAAEAFHTQADEWARDVAGLYDLADAARDAAARARDNAWTYRAGGV
ncbi:hypothetical protein ASD56_04530 [Microbacterium sp. Root166]|uniref:hypothetical protein n=1 Tax=Microbacterium sp. Root166 TaxID=1736478 RepID=UPI0006FE5857|nr:hypothetical protein [Microbacterium sp. Root166]KQZ85584.1 hypothetical protein ASD56_04530 [Microbacterium sp. Root166]